MKALLASLIGNPRVVHLPPEECVFCQIATRKHRDSQTIIYEDDTIVIFPDIKPAAVGHFQIVTKKHILNVDTLIENPTREHYDLGTFSIDWFIIRLIDRSMALCIAVRHMLEKGQEVLLLQLQLQTEAKDGAQAQEQQGSSSLSLYNNSSSSNNNNKTTTTSRLKFGFHMEPFHSVLHLHMHAFILPHVPRWGVWKYHPYTPWWLPAQDLLAQLQALL